MKKKTEATISGLKVVVKKNWYDGLWELLYEDGARYAGPYKTRKEAIEWLEEYARK